MARSEVGYVLKGVAKLVNNAALYFSLGIGRIDSLLKPGKAIYTEQQYILNTPVFEVV